MANLTQWNNVRCCGLESPRSGRGELRSLTAISTKNLRCRGHLSRADEPRCNSRSFVAAGKEPQAVGRKERPAKPNAARTIIVTPNSRTLKLQDPVRMALASRLISSDLLRSTRTERLNVSVRPCSGMLARIAAGVV